jgi:hypothetical protein
MKGSPCIKADLLNRIEGTVMRMLVARKIPVPVIDGAPHPVILGTDTKTWGRMRRTAAKCPYTPSDIRTNLVLARRVVTSRAAAKRNRLKRLGRL